MARKKPDEKVYLFDKPENVERLLKVFYWICGLLFVLDFVVHRHTIHDWEQLPAFYAIFGFIAFVMLVVVSKLMRKLLMRKEDYYDVDD
jgi:hypothetical protein